MIKKIEVHSSFGGRVVTRNYKTAEGISLRLLKYLLWIMGK